MTDRRRDDCTLSDADLRAAMREMKAYIDVTEEDLKRIFEIALRHAKERLAARVPVADVMTRSVVSVGPHADLHDAAMLLSENRISGMPVVDEQQRVIGVLSEADLLVLAGMRKEHTFKDILHRILGEPVTTSQHGEKVQDVMSSPPITTRADDDVAEVARILDERRIKRLPVVDDEGRLIGIVSRADVVRASRKA